MRCGRTRRCCVPMPGSDTSHVVPALTVRGVVAGYLPGISILNGMALDVLAGEVRCVLGPNGTGKSTLLKVMFGSCGAGGRDQLGPQSLRGVAAHQMASHGITYCRSGQACSVPVGGCESTVGDLVLPQGASCGRRTDRARLREFPILRERRHQLAGPLSGGQQRQLEIARALLTDPTVMLIDEPTASVEPRVTAQIYELIAGCPIREAILLWIRISKAPSGLQTTST